MLSCVDAQGELASATVALSATSPCRETTLLRKQVGESASPRLDATDRMPYRVRSIKANAYSGYPGPWLETQTVCQNLSTA